VRDIETIDAELRLVAALRRAARERGGPLPSIVVAEALPDQRHELTKRATTRHGNFRNLLILQRGVGSCIRVVVPPG
jgi:hypothetical protein